MSDAAGFANHEHWNAVKDVCQRLHQNGHRALLAGGCVRDLLMGRKANDFDIATDATPAQVEALWPRAIMVGASFGVSILPFDGFQVEVATFRQDLEYRDGRRPEGVRFATPEEDAERRDFTVNALFFDIEKNEVIDFVDGRKDLALRVIRAVGDADRRFEEDKLRILRAVRFAAQLDFEIAPATLAAIERRQTDVAVVSRERVRDEILKLLKTPQREKGLRLLLSTGLFATLFPNLAAALTADDPIDAGAEPASATWLQVFAALPVTDTTAGLAAFFALDHAGARENLKALKLESKQIEQVLFILKNESHFADPEKIRLGELILLCSHPAAVSARAFAAARQPERKNALETLARTSGNEDLAQTLAGHPLPPPFITGEIAKTHGVKPGPLMGRLLHEAYLLQLERKFRDRDAAEAWLKTEIGR